MNFTNKQRKYVQNLLVDYNYFMEALWEYYCMKVEAEFGMSADQSTELMKEEHGEG